MVLIMSNRNMNLRLKYLELKEKKRLPSKIIFYVLTTFTILAALIDILLKTLIFY
jgi:hypothetical protein